MTADGRFLSRTWWAIGPAFVVLVGRFAVDRACADPDNLVPALASRPFVAWTMAAMYVLAHLWLLGAYLRQRARRLRCCQPRG
jgi:hypothetical protein